MRLRVQGYSPGTHVFSHPSASLCHRFVLPVVLLSMSLIEPQAISGDVGWYPEWHLLYKSTPPI